MKIKYSIIVVCFNAGSKLLLTVNSILAQTYEEYEIIIKDGLSTDHALDTLPKDDRIKIASCKDTGIYDAMNQAVKLAAGDYFLFLNCGDTFHTGDVLTQTTAIIEQQPSAQHLIYYGDTYNETTQALVSQPQQLTPFTCYRHIPCHQACFYAASLFAIRQYDLRYQIRADYEHFLHSYYRCHADPAYLHLTVADYEGGGFSEAPANLHLDQQEHRMITAQYMSRKAIFLYRLILLLTLRPLRTYLSHNTRFAATYNCLKNRCYHMMKHHS
ncbi:MAG: glycosyltransferase [Lachnospiraceae bacterium]